MVCNISKYNISIKQQQYFVGTIALCMLLKRLSYPCRLQDLSLFFNYSPQALSQILKAVINFIIENHSHLLENLNVHGWLDRNRYNLYAEVRYFNMFCNGSFTSFQYISCRL